MSLKNKLNRLKPHLSIPEREKSPVSMENNKNHENIPYLSEWEEKGITPYFLDGDYCLVREVVYPLNHQHGIYQLGQFLHAIKAWNKTNHSHPLSANGYRPEDLFFFDTETTGLGGGVGNTIFLLGHAQIQEERVVVRQHILPRPGSEIPLYSSFLEKVDYTTLVTYNGKAFDWPQVKSRHTLIRNHVPKLPQFGHFDLFHASRRIWKHKLDRLKLSVVEKEVLDIHRVDDVPGFLAPMIYFDFVETQNPEGMMGILKHNELDILSLITLYTHLTYQLLGIDQSQTVQEAFEVGRWYSYIGEEIAAEKTFSEISAGSTREAFLARWHLSLHLKKQKNFIASVEIWEDLSEIAESDIAFDSLLELSKWYEHREKDYDKAFSCCQKAQAILTSELGNKGKLVGEMTKRMERITKKFCNKNVKK